MVGKRGEVSGNGSKPYSIPKRSKAASRYFFLNKKLHKVIQANRPGDIMTAWCYPCRKRHTYVLSDVKKYSQKAFDLKEVCALVGRHRVIVENYIRAGAIEKPQRTYSLNGQFNPGKYKMSEDDVVALHEYLLTVHVGRPRKDGLIKPGKLPTRQELRAMMKNHETVYVKNSQGEFTPIWKEVDWS
jgi:hypothetical protein